MAHRPSVHKRLPRALLRWGLILVVCVAFAVPTILTKLLMRDAARMASMSAQMERAAIKHAETAKGDDRLDWLDRAEYYRRLRSRHEREARWPWW